MNVCEVCDKKFHGLQAWATICPRCMEEIVKYRAGLEKEKVITGGQENGDKKKAWEVAYYRKHNKPRKCIICGKEFYVKGKSSFCDTHRTDYSMHLEGMAGGRWTKQTRNDIIKVMKQEYKDSFKEKAVEPQVIQPLNSFDKHILQLGRC